MNTYVILETMELSHDVHSWVVHASSADEAFEAFVHSEGLDSNPHRSDDRGDYEVRAADPIDASFQPGHIDDDQFEQLTEAATEGVVQQMLDERDTMRMIAEAHVEGFTYDELLQWAKCSPAYQRGELPDIIEGDA